MRTTDKKVDLWVVSEFMLGDGGGEEIPSSQVFASNQVIYKDLPLYMHSFMYKNPKKIPQKCEV